MAQARSVRAPERQPAENRRWPVPRSAVFIITTSACLWAVLLSGVCSLIW